MASDIDHGLTSGSTQQIIIAATTDGTTAGAAAADNLAEGDEDVDATVAARSTGPVYTIGTANTAGSTITDIDNVIEVEAVDVTEEDGTPIFTFSFEDALVTAERAFTVDYTIANTLASDIDHGLTSGSTQQIIIAATTDGTTAGAAAADNLAEGDEDVDATVAARSTGPVYTIGTANTAGSTITDIDNVIEVEAVDVTEEDGTPIFTFSFEDALVTAERAFTVDYTIANTLASDIDHGLTSGSTQQIIIAATTDGTTAGAAAADNLAEGDEDVDATVAARSTGPVYTIGTANTAGSTITDIDNVISIEAFSATEPDNATELFRFSFPTSPATVTAERDFTINYTLANNTTIDADHSSSAGSTTILVGAGDNFTDFLTLIDDDIVEASEEYIDITITAYVPGATPIYTIGTATDQATIFDEDQAVITMTPVASPVTEGDVAGDNSVIEFDVEVSNYVDIFYQLSFSSVGVLTATEGTDFEATAGDIQYPALSDPTDGTGTRTFRISVPIVEDETVEAATESFYMSLFNIRDIADDAILTSERDIVFAATSDQTDYYVEGEITDDDIAYVVWDNSLPYQAGEGGDVTFRAKLVGSVDQSISVVYLPQNGDTEVQAINNVDFVSSSGSFTLSGTNGSTDDVDFSTLEDNLVEVDEEFKLRMSLISAGGKNVKFSNSESSPSAVPNITKTGKIIDNDAVKISVASTVDANESTGLATFTFSMADDIDGGDATKDDATNTSKVVDVLTTVYYRIDTSSTYTRHGSGLDFYDPTATKNGSDEIVGSITFPANSNADVDLDITINDDNIVELDETFTITITDILTGVEPDDDVTLAGSFPGVAERLSSVTTDVDTDTYTIINDEFADVVMTTDVVSAAEGTQLMTVTMELRDGDNLANTITVDEAVTVEYILNEDEALRADLDDNIRFSVVNSPDYAGTITFAAGESSKDIDVIWTDDQVVEDDEDFEFAITSVSASGRAVDEDLTTPTPVEQTNGNTAALTILNDDFTDFTITVEAGDDNDVNEEVGTLSYTVTSTKAVEAGFELLYSIAGSSVSEKAISTGGLDLTSAESGVVQFLGNAGEEVALDITIRDDFLVELDEELTVSIAIPATDYTPTNGSYPFVFNQTVDTDPYYGAITNANVVTESEYGYIRNTDAAVITIADETPLDEGDPGDDVSYTFIVSLSNPIDVDVEVPLTYEVDGAADNSDYIADKLSVVFDALDETAATGPYTRDFLISVVEDIQVEDDEVFTATLPLTAGLDWDTESARNVTVPTDGDTNEGTTTFLNDDAAEFKIETLAINNSNEEAGSLITYTISLYDEDGSTLTSADEEISVDIAFDMSNLNDNNFITDFVEATAFTDGTSGTVTATPVSGVYTFTVTFDADQTQETFSFKFDDDDVVEEDAGETYSVSLVGNSETNISDNDNADVITNDGASQVYTINEINDKATVTITDNTVAGSIAEDGAGSVVYTISSDKDIEVPITISYTIAEELTGEAFAATDINTAGSGTALDLQYNATDDAYTTDDGASAVTFTVVINTDDIVEADEDYDVTLTSTIGVPGAATYLATDYDANVLVAAAGSGGAITNTITNDDDIELASFTGDTDNEVNDLDMALSLVKAADIDVHLTIQESVAGTSALTNGQAYANNANSDTDRAQTDFTAPGTTSGSFTYLTIPAGSTTADETTVTVTDDDIVERNEPFYLTVTGVEGASAAYDEVVTGQTLDDRTADFIITNDDAIEFTFAGNVTDAEEDGPFTFTMSADAEVDVDYSVDYLVASGGGNNTESDFTDIADFGTYTASVPFTGAFTAASAEEVPFDINIVNDNIVELNETFTVSFRSVGDYTTIFNDAGYTFGDVFTGTATGTIENDPTVDNAVITVSSVASQTEGTSGSSSVTYNISISNPVDAGFTLPYEVLTAGGLGTVNASDFTNASITYNIDGAGAVDPASDVIPVALNGTTTPSGTDIIVVEVPVVEDAIVEPDEDMSFTLTNAFVSPGSRPIYYEDAGTPAATASSTSTLINDDATTFTLQVTSNGDGVDFSTGETTDNISFTLTASNQIQDNVTLELNFDLSTVVSTAVDATQGDYVPTGLGTDDDVIFTFGGSNATSQTFTLDLFDDASDKLVEIDEVFGVSLTDLDVTTTYTGLTFGGTGDASDWIEIDVTGDAALSVTLEDDDESLIEFTAGTLAVTVNESDDTETATLTFTINVSEDIDTSVDVVYSTSAATDGPALFNSDFTVLTSVTETVQTAGTYDITVTVTGDDYVELDEELTVTLQSLTGTSLTTGSPGSSQDAGRAVFIDTDNVATGTITNDDSEDVSITASVTQSEEDGDVVLTVSIPNESDDDIIVNIGDITSLANSGQSRATAGDDYTLPASTTIDAGELSATYTISVTNDAVMERHENFDVEISSIDPNGRNINIGTAFESDITLNNEDILVFTLADDAVNTAGRDEDEEFSYTLTGSAAIESYGDDVLPFTIDWSVDVASATDPGEDDSEAGDFDAIDGTFDLGGLTAGFATTYDLVLVDDNTVELDEHFSFIVDGTDSDLNALGRITHFTATNEPSISYEGVIADSDVAQVSLVTTGASTINEGDSGPANIGFNVTLDFPVESDITVEFTSQDGNALGFPALTSDGDYVSNTGTATFLAGEVTPVAVTIPVTGDKKVEEDETVGMLIQNMRVRVDGTLTLEAGTDWSDELSIGTNEIEGTITNDDYATLVINDATNELEGDVTPGTSTFEVYLYDTDDLTTPVAVDRQVKVNFNTVDGVAVSNITSPPGDYVSNNGTVTFPADDASPQTVTVTYVVDGDPEEDEAFEVELQNNSNFIIGDGSEDAHYKTFVAVGATDALRKGTGLVLNDDRPIFTTTLNSNGDEDATASVVFDVTLTGAIIGVPSVTVDYTITGGSAVAGVDYDGSVDPLTGTLTFNSGDATQQVTIAVLQDALAEGAEDLTITLSNALPSSNAELGEAADITATGSITDNDPIAIAISGDQTVLENAGTATVSISFTGEIVEDVTVDYTVTSSGADATDFDVDETTYTGSFTFSASDGASVTNGSTDVVIDLLDDGIVEGNETVTVTLDAVTTVVDTDFVAALPSVVTIDDQDAASISISSFSVGEADGVATVTVTSDTQIDRDVTVQLTVAETGTASDADADASVSVGGSDFAASVQTVTISALDLTGSFDVTINEDDVVEGSEDFDISIATLGGDGITNSADVTLGTSTGVVTITDNDAAQISIADVTVDEGTGLANVLLSLDKVIDEDITVDYFTTQATAIDGSDYTGVTAGAPAITINAGSGLAAMPINVPVTINNADGGLVEGTETLTVTVENILGGALTDQSISFLDDNATVTINDDDQAIISIADISDTETNLDGAQTVNITLDAPVDQAITFRLSTVAVTATDADNGTTPDVDETDYVQISNQLITVDASTLVPNATVEVTINDDNLVEANETFDLRLSTLTATGRDVIFNGGGTTVSSTVSITEDDAAIINIADVDQTATGDDESNNMSFVISITNPIDQDVELTLNTTNGLATAGSDFTALTDEIYTIPASTLSANLSPQVVVITPDVLVERDENFTLAISGFTVPAGRDITLDGGGTTKNASGLIEDNDEAQITIVETATGTEGVGETITFTISMSNPVDASVVFNASTLLNDNATVADLIQITDQQVTFPAESNEDKTVTVNLTNNDIVEGDESFDLELTDLTIPTGRAVAFYDNVPSVQTTISSTATISDDDSADLTVADITVDEGDATATVVVTTDFEVDTDVSVDVTYEVTGSATDTEDYTSATATSTATITAGSMTSDIVIPLLDGAIVEGTETLDITIGTLTFTDATHAIEITDDAATVTINDDDVTTLSIVDASSDEGIDIVIEVTSDLAFDKAVTVDLASLAGSATATDDYGTVAGTVTIAQGATSGTVNVTTVDDTVVDGEETFSGTISNLSVGTGDGYNASIADADGVFTINDLDAALLSIASATSFTEGGTATVTLSSDVAIDEAVEVTFTYSGVSATTGDDFTENLGPITLPALSTADGATLSVELPNTAGVTSSEVVEGTETFTVSIDGITVANDASHDVSETGGDASATVTIDDNDTAVITLADATASEGDAVTFTVSTDVEFDKNVTVSLSTADNTALAGASEDYTALAASVVTITGGTLSGSITTTTVENVIVEGTEDFTATISGLSVGPVGTDGYDASITDADGTYTINDDDVTTLSIVDASSDEGIDIVIEVTSDLAFDKAVTVDLASLAGSATATDDYGTVAGTVTIAQGATSGTVNVTTVDDTVVDGEETFSGTISNLSVGTGDGYNASIADADGVFTINDLDAALLSIASATSFTEGGTATVTLSSDVAIDEAVEVTFTYSGVSATTGDDFTENLGPITLPALSTADGATLSVELPNTAGVTSSEVVEGTETFTVSIDGITVANDASHDVSETGGDASATVTIDDNDTAVITLADATASEGDAVTFTVSTDVEFDKNVTVSLSTADNTALAGASEDYTALAASVVTITGGTLSGSITTTTVENVIVEGTEDFTATISGLSVGPVGTDGYDASITDADGTYTINDDDAATLTLSGVTVDESAGTATVTLTSSLAADADISVSLAVTDGTASATDGDYSATDGLMTIAAGSTSTTATITVDDDTIAELDETVVNTISGLTVSSDHDVTLANTTADVTITDDDSAEITITGVTIDEADGTADLTVTISGQVDTEVTVSAATANGTALVSDDDYIAKTQTLSFAALSIADQTFSVAVNDDNTVENDETFAVNLSGLSSGGRDVTLTSTTANVTITNDDAAIISIADVTINEAAGSVTLTINMDNPVDEAVTFTARTIQGTARNVDDYERVSGVTYTIDEGELLPSTTASIVIVDDNLVEATETFEYELSSITSLKNVRFTGGTGTTSATVTVTDADAAVISINSAEVSEGDGVMTFTVSMSAPVDEAVSVYATSGNVEASAGSDFTSVNNSQITFSAGSNSDKTVSVSITDNTIVEAIETFTITLNNIEPASGKNVSFVNGESTAVGIGTINDDDAATITINDVSADEGVSGTKDFVFTATLTGRVDEQVDVPYSTSDVTATSGVDYTAGTGTISFAANNVSGIETKTITVSVNGDLEVEVDEIFNVVLGALSLTGKDVTITDGTGEGLIVNDDVLPEIVAGQSFSVSEAAVVNELIGVIQVADLTPGSVSWSITFGNTDQVFDINDTNNQLFVADNSNLDRDKVGGDSYTLTVTVSDGVNTSESESISITVTDINDNDPVITADQVFAVSDDAPLNTAVGTVLVTDADENPVFGDFLITSGNGDGVFAINGSTGVITVADNETLDFESTASYTLTITVSDGANTSANGTVVINVTDTNDAPEALTITDAEDEDENTENVDIIESASVQTVVATFETTDIDAGDSHTYSLVDHPDGDETQNALFRIQGNELQVNQDLVNLGLVDGIATIAVQSEDTGGGTIVEVFQIVIINDPLLGLDQIYNVITPGRVDGLNDFWTIEGIEAFPSAEIVVNDKFGNVVYRSIGYDSPFDGTKGNTELPTDTYTYRIELNDGSGRTYEGSITILAYK